LKAKTIYPIKYTGEGGATSFYRDGDIETVIPVIHKEMTFSKQVLLEDRDIEKVHTLCTEWIDIDFIIDKIKSPNLIIAHNRGFNEGTRLRKITVNLRQINDNVLLDISIDQKPYKIEGNIMFFLLRQMEVFLRHIGVPFDRDMYQILYSKDDISGPLQRNTLSLLVPTLFVGLFCLPIYIRGDFVKFIFIMMFLLALPYYIHFKDRIHMLKVRKNL
ncbi:MAG: hypothetical protein ACEROO_08125, partial [Candidatus Bathyarchaeota archaeon]